MKYWQHVHTFTAVDDRTSLIHEHIEYCHHGGVRGVLTSVFLFNWLALMVLFTYRKFITKRKIEGTTLYIWSIAYKVCNRNRFSFLKRLSV